MVVLCNLDVEVKKYVLHARVDSMEQLETVLKFYEAIKILLTDGNGAKEHANILESSSTTGRPNSNATAKI